MCGIVGYVDVGRALDLEAALAAIAHRGPDARGRWDEPANPGPRVVFGHVRLSILDLSAAANQPFLSADGHWAIVFNGEIYNHAALRVRLAARGVVFRTRSDTEVLLAAVREWGLDCLGELDGMFAFVALDRAARRLYLGRDQFGIKPLYFVHDEYRGGFAFGSEIRALAALGAVVPEPDPAALAEFLLNGFLYEPATGIRGVRKLAPGECGVVDLASGRLSLRRYDDPLHPAAGGVPELLQESLSLQCLADVPVGLFFSGGIDSTVLAAVAPHPLQALFVDYGSTSAEPGDGGYAAAVAAALDMPVTTVRHEPEAGGPEAILAAFAAVAAGTEEPISDYTYLASAEIARAARDRGFKVMLSGMGGDELYAGYPRHRLARYAAAVRAVRPPLALAAPWLRRRERYAKKVDRLLGFAGEPEFGMAYTRLVGYFAPDEVCRMLGAAAAVTPYRARLAALLAPAAGLSPLKQAMFLDRYGFLAHNLTVTDRSSMAHAIEVRVPLMTPKLAAAALALPDAALLGARETKRPLRALLRERLPRALVDRPKVGFNPPLDGKIAALGAQRILTVLRAGRLREHLDLALPEALVHRHFAGAGNETYRLWQLLYLGYWLDAVAQRPATATVAA